VSAPAHGRPTPPSRGVLFVAVSTFIGGLVAAVLGGVLGAVLYEVTGPPWAQLGVEFEGLDWVAAGVLRGGAVGMIVTGLVAVAVRHHAAGRRRLGAVLGGILLGTAGGLGTFPATAPLWVGPVLLVAAVGALVGAVAGAWLASKGIGTSARVAAPGPRSG